MEDWHIDLYSAVNRHPYLVADIKRLGRVSAGGLHLVVTVTECNEGLGRLLGCIDEFERKFIYKKSFYQF